MHRAPDRRQRERSALAGALAVVAALLAAGGGQGARAPGELEGGAAAWRGFVDGERSAVAVGRADDRRPPQSLARRSHGRGGRPRDRVGDAELDRGGAGRARSRSRPGCRARESSSCPDFVYTRTFNGFAAPIDGRALALLERDPDVVGVYPVRAAYPASLSRAELRAPQYAAGSGRRADLRLPGFDGAA